MRFFVFRKEMLEYCRNDVDILRQACLKFRKLLMSATGVQRELISDKGKKEMKWFGAMDPFDSVTKASVCMNVFRTIIIEEEWRVKLEGKKEWILAKLMDGKLYVLRDNKWIHETELIGGKVGEKERICTYAYCKNPSQWLQ